MRRGCSCPIKSDSRRGLAINGGLERAPEACGAQEVCLRQPESLEVLESNPAAFEQPENAKKGVIVVEGQVVGHPLALEDAEHVDAADEDAPSHACGDSVRKPRSPFRMCAFCSSIGTAQPASKRHSAMIASLAEWLLELAL